MLMAHHLNAVLLVLISIIDVIFHLCLLINLFRLLWAWSRKAHHLLQESSVKVGCLNSLNSFLNRNWGYFNP